MRKTGDANGTNAQTGEAGSHRKRRACKEKRSSRKNKIHSFGGCAATLLLLKIPVLHGEKQGCAPPGKRSSRETMTRAPIMHPSLKMLAAVVAAFLLWGLLLAYAASPAQADTITVNSLSDTAANEGKCTLREALTAANTNTVSGVTAGECAAGSVTGSDIIDIEVTGTVNLGGVLPELSSNMEIEVPSAPPDKWVVNGYRSHYETTNLRASLQ
jgi:CSLREA domain-containing protein